ncbi:hypothetical protein PACTADRAFT_50700 [Pachysolen tannophilus NRRL Y-2460]|uniref:low-specificity L-threonine aldolase n=1 Tax=Pachysolen tannophilus NRRL Y-2460 TaxID=669874 RepID=A0A1E4TT43_PACTA|nr:hypothetical protein PACTADRAFT_50700 [Pachysolen tannophilus NRRL Y-2460]
MASSSEFTRAHNEFRSDTFTVPTKEMLEAALVSSLGDSVYQEDKDTLDLEKKVADLAGKEAGLFCVSGTLSNQIGLRANLHQPPHSVLCDYRGHVYLHEAGGLATLSQAMVSAVHPANGIHLTLEDIIDNFIPDDGNIHAAPTKVISLENTLHGLLFPLDEIKRISAWCKENNVKLHLDGARLWNASVETGISIKEYCSYFDSVSLCLSKSLGAPIGSVLVGNPDFIAKANHFKKQNGGGIRQGGMLARMASIAIDQNLSKIKRSHEMAKELGKFCEENNIALECPVHTNFVFLDMNKMKMSNEVLLANAKKYNVKQMGCRVSFHFQISQESFENVKKAIYDTYLHSLEHPFYATAPARIYDINNR